MLETSSTRSSTTTTNCNGADTLEGVLGKGPLFQENTLNYGEKDIEVQKVESNHSVNGMSGLRLALFLFGLSICTFLSTLDISIIAAALPRIASDFNAQSQMSWVATAYLLTFNAFSPLYGRFSDIFGRKVVILFACSIFFLGSIGCGAASSMTMLILFRAAKGVGGAGLGSMVMIILSDMFDDIAERAKYQSIAYAALGISSVVGPFLGGAFVQHSTWRWCFYINLPLCALAISLISYFHRIPFERANLRSQLAQVDYLGVLFIIATVVCLLLPLTWGGTTYPWNSAVIISLFCVFIVLMVMMVIVENKAKENAVIPIALLSNRDVALLLTINTLVGLVFMGCTFYIPLFFQVVQNATTTSSGLRLMPNVVGIVFSTFISSALMRKIKDVRVFLAFGTGVMTTGVGLLNLWKQDTSVGMEVGIVILMGLGQGFIFQNVMLASQEHAGPKDVAVATALVGFANSIGGAIGVAVCAAVFNNGLARNLEKLPTTTQQLIEKLDVVENMNAVAELPDDVRIEVIQAYTDSFKFLFTVLTPILGFAFLLTFLIRKTKKRS
ncbi:hypothetical protein EMPS_00288 [Entomortierella parvispora]|uniref:Major facilitator superfamily (MFS) profile domain-containing protein n=1 Tax=Entomortierella parvispora TaxID=205924 RepID=A0A9P3LRQ5_9FUNG|nr:hypothetical protein EMPS_00288 [Entomortierella parvispora]